MTEISDDLLKKVIAAIHDEGAAAASV